MRIRNLQKFAIYLGYAGLDKKGWNVPAGKLSPELPAQRFYDQHLQHDWKRGAIDLVLNDADVAVLGPDVEHLTKRVVTVAGDSVVEAAQPALVQAALAASMQTAKAPTPPAPPPVVATVVPPMPPVQPVVPPEPSADIPAAVVVPPVERPALAELTPVPDSPAAAMAAGPTAFAGVACAECGRKNRVQMDPRKNLPLCRYCRASTTRHPNTAIPAKPPPAEPPLELPAQRAETCPHPLAPVVPPVDANAPVQDPHVPGIPHTAAPQVGRSLRDLQQANKLVSYAPKFGNGDGAAIPSLQVADKISRQMGDIRPKTGTPSPLEAL